MIEVSNLRARFGINHIERLSLQPKQCVAVIGPNGAGKSTLLRLLFGRLSPLEGSITLDGVRTDQMTVRQRLKYMSYLPSGETLAPGMTVFDSVALGFHATQNSFTVLSKRQKQHIDHVIEQVSMTHKAHKPVHTLSSGEYQRVRLARIFIQPAPVLILDEPFAFLDPHQALNLMDIFAELRDAGKTIIMTLHELNHAARSCDEIVVINDGHVVIANTVASVLSSEIIREVFGVDFVSIAHPDSQKTHLLLPDRSQAGSHE